MIMALLAMTVLACGGESESAASSVSSGNEANAEEARSPDPEAPSLLSVGTLAPDFSAPDQSGTPRDLASERGRPVVLYFYPRDATPGCTVEACAFRDAWSDYESRGVTIFGVSVDDVASHRAFAEEHELPFPLIADVDQTITDAYGARATQGDVVYSRRVTYIIDGEGLIQHVFEDVDPGVHSEQVLAAVDAL